jgi:hypothetical protein
VTVALGVPQTPFLTGPDPFRQFHETDETSTGSLAPAQLGSETDRPRSLLVSLAAVAAAVAPTASSPPSFAALVRGLVERSPVTRASIQELLPLLGFSSLAHAPADLPETKAVPHGAAARALAAVADLSAWLGMTEDQVADIAQFSRRNLSNWRAGLGSYQKTVRGLFEIHALMDGLVRGIGADGAATWIALQSTTGSPRRQLLATGAGRAQLLSEAQSLLFAKVGREAPTAEFEDEQVTVIPGAHRDAAESLARTPPQRRRRPG